MYNPELADKVIREMLKGRDSSAAISQNISEDHEEVKRMMRYFNSQYPGDFKSFKAGINAEGMKISIPRMGHYEALINSGGYTKIAQEEKAEKDKREFDRTLDNRSKEETIKRAKRAEVIAIISLIVALIAAIISIFK